MKILRPLLPTSLGLALVTLLLVVTGIQSSLAHKTSPSQPLIRYVAKSGLDGGDCADSQFPCLTIQYAIDRAEAGDEVRVAGGVYTDVNVDGWLAQIAYISKTLTLRGGYSITNWITPEHSTHLTILDASEDGRVLYITGPISATVEGFQLTGGNSYDVDYPNDGGGVYILDADVTISACEIISNITPVNGGGLFAESSSLVIKNSAIGQNIAWYGGGIYTRNSNVTLDRNNISYNLAWNGSGGGVYVTQRNITATANIIEENDAGYEGGGLYMDTINSVLERNTICHHDALYGGGFYLATDHTIIRNNLICANRAGVSGGGMYMGGWKEGRIISNRIVDNYTEESLGAGMAILNSTDGDFINNVIAGNSTSGVFVFDVQFLRWSHNTIANNHGLEDGSGIYVLDDPTSPTSMIFTNTIIVSQTIGVVVPEGNTVILNGTLWGSDTWANDQDWSGDGTILTGTVNIWADPLFVDPEAGDYHLQSGSPAIDSGVDSGILTDIDGEPRPNGGFDIGADKSWLSGQVLYLPLLTR